MTKQQALQQAKQNLKLFRAAQIEHMFGRSQELNEESFGHRHGWFQIEGFNFSEEEITGSGYDWNQGGIAYL